MKKFIIVLISIFLLLFSLALGYFLKTHINNKNSMTESIDYYLYDNDQNRFDKIKINKNGDVEYKGKVLLTDNGEPLNKDTAYTTIELKILFAAMHIEPREGCDPADTDTNGTLGCYIDIPND